MVGRRLLLTLFVVVATTVVDAADNDGDGEEEAVSIGGGGLGWQNLGVSLEPNCLISKGTAYIYNTAKNTVTTKSHEEGKQQISCQYEDLTWLLHPSSGFIPNGSLCGILGPR
jgi:hypothetical protein